MKKKKNKIETILMKINLLKVVIQIWRLIIVMIDLFKLNFENIYMIWVMRWYLKEEISSQIGLWSTRDYLNFSIFNFEEMIVIETIITFYQIKKISSFSILWINWNWLWLWWTSQWMTKKWLFFFISVCWYKSRCNQQIHLKIIKLNITFYQVKI